MSIPEYPWFDQAPKNLKTRNQLAELGLRPGGPVVARVVWKRGKRWADLFDLNSAKPKKPPTEAQLAALAKAREASASRIADRWDWEARERADDRKYAAERAAAALVNPNVVLLDTETTDLDGYIVQIAVLAVDGAVLLDTFVQPNAPISAGARAVHGISDAQLADAPTFADIEPQLREVLTGKEVWVYNLEFDMGILQNELHRLYRDHWPDDVVRRRQIKQWFKTFRKNCLMEDYAAFVNEWSEYHGSYRWHPLGGGHTALADCRAALEVLQEMAAAHKGEKPDGSDPS